jgi:uncharacterized cupin superfamily protein
MKTFNVHEASFEYDDADPDGYRCGMDRFGPKLGAEKLGASVYELPAGQTLVPYHYEYDEEWLMVLEGELTVRHPEGETVMRAGEITAFPPGPAGAHQTSNRTDQTVRIMMFSTRIEPAVAVYPDSNKMGVWTGRKDEHVMVRLGTRLEYYDGEA